MFIFIGSKEEFKALTDAGLDLNKEIASVNVEKPKATIEEQLEGIGTSIPLSKPVSQPKNEAVTVANEVDDLFGDLLTQPSPLGNTTTKSPF